MFADFCECRDVQMMSISDIMGSGNNDEALAIEECPTLDIQELCNGTVASPCNCQPFQACEV